MISQDYPNDNLSNGLKTKKNPSQETQESSNDSPLGVESSTDDQTGEESTSEIKEREAREKIFAEFKEEYFQILDEVPLELERKVNLISELDASLAECEKELHEDLSEYTRYAKSSAEKPDSNIMEASGHEPYTGTNETENKLLVLAQPTLWGVVPIPLLPSDQPAGLPDHLKILLASISRNMCRLQELSRDKLNLAESIYQTIDQQAKRLDSDLESYQDLEEQYHEIDRQRDEIESTNQSNTLMSLPTTEPHKSRSPSRKVVFEEAEDSDEPDETATPKSKNVSLPSRRISTPAATDTPQQASTYHDASSPPKTLRKLRSASVPMQTMPISSFNSAGLTETTRTKGKRRASPELSDLSMLRTTPRKSSRHHRQLSLNPIPTESNVNPSSESRNSDEEDGRLYCYCNQVSFGDMVGCDNLNCQGGEWFHLSCAGLTELPPDDDQADWYCDVCLEKFGHIDPLQQPSSSSSSTTTSTTDSTTTGFVKKKRNHKKT